MNAENFNINDITRSNLLSEDFYIEILEDADELRNKNLNKSAEEMQQGQQKEPTEQIKKDEVNKSDERLA